MDDLVRWLGEQLDEDAAAVGEVKPDSSLSPTDPIDFILSGQDLATDATEAAERHIRRFADPARVLREIEVDRELLAEYERLLRASAAHRKESDRMAEAGDNDPIRRAALRRESDYLPAMLNVLEGWAKRKAGVYADRPGYAEAIASAE